MATPPTVNWIWSGIQGPALRTDESVGPYGRQMGPFFLKIALLPSRHSREGQDPGVPEVLLGGIVG
jgi:hypothetical protein